MTEKITKLNDEELEIVNTTEHKIKISKTQLLANKVKIEEMLAVFEE